MEKDRIICGDALEALKALPSGSVHCCVTSPPYYGLRDYGVDGQIGREATPGEYVARLAGVFGEVWRVLRDDGTLWVNLGDTYCGAGGKVRQSPVNHNAPGCKPKDLIGVPWLLALRLRDDGWYLRNAAVWEKANPMPEGVKDRLTRSYEFVFLLAKSKRYFFDAAAIAEPVAPSTIVRMRAARGGHTKYSDGIPGQTAQGINSPRAAGLVPDELMPVFRNKRDVWHINTVPYSGAHFAAFPPKLAETCILAGCPKGGVVLDPFFGSGTSGLAAKDNGRRYIGIDINEDYCRLARERIGGDEA
jgi:DNA modification methylase